MRSILELPADDELGLDDLFVAEAKLLLLQ